MHRRLPHSTLYSRSLTTFYRVTARILHLFTF